MCYLEMHMCAETEERSRHSLERDGVRERHEGLQSSQSGVFLILELCFPSALKCFMKFLSSIEFLIIIIIIIINSEEECTCDFEQFAG